MTPRRLARAALALAALAPCLLFAAALPVEIGAAAALFVGGAELLLGLGLVAALLAGAARGRARGAAVACGVAALLGWHARELLWEPRDKKLLLALVVALAAALAVAARRAAGGAARRWAVLAGAAFALLALALPLAYRRSESLRLVLLRDDRALGTPLYLALDGDPEGALARAERPAAEPPPTAGEGAPPAAPHAAGARDVVVLLVDTLRADALRPWGGSEELPGFDALARSGIVFGDVLAGTSWTKPSVASLFTGLEAEEHGVRGLADALAERHRTLAERFRESGYATAAFSTNLAQIDRASGFAQGFDEFAELRGRGPYADAGEVAGAVERWLARPRGPAPLFLYVHFLDPHAPYRSGAAPRSAWPAAARPAYRAEVRTVDRALARLVPLLRERLRDPVVLLVSDHGEELGEHGGAGHGATLYREVVRVPALLAGAGGAGGVIAAPLELRDFYDLLPRFAGGEVDVAAWAAARARAVRRASLHFRWPAMPRHRPYLRAVAAWRLEEARWVFLRSSYGATRELYDRIADPLERRNVAAAHPEEVARLEALLAAREPRWSPVVRVARQGDAAAQLRALGYL